MYTGPIDVRDYLAILWARRWTIIVVVVTTTAVAVALSYRQTPSYVASAEVLVQAPRFDLRTGPTTLGSTNMLTEVQVANSLPVREMATERLDARDLEDASVEAAQVSQAETLQFTASSSDPTAAMAAANAHADAYLDLRRREVLAELEASREPYVTKLAELDVELERLERILRTVEGVRRTTLDNRYSVLLTERLSVAQQLGDFATKESLEVGQVLRSAELPGSPSSPNHVRDALVGFLVGLALGIGLALFRDRMDERLRGREELEFGSGAPVLGYIPRLSSKDDSPISLSAPTSSAAEAYKALQVRLRHVTRGRSGVTLLVTSSVAGEGKTSTTANLAIALAHARMEVAIVSADLRRPRLETLFPGHETKGLTEVLLGHRLPRDVIGNTTVKGLSIVATGPKRERDQALALLGSDAMRDLLTELREVADYILIDMPPLLTSPDVVAVAPLVDGALLVADPQLVQRPAFEQASHELVMIGVPVVGIVVNRYDPKRFSPYGSGYGYGYRTNGREPSSPPMTRIDLHEVSPVGTEAEAPDRAL